MVNDGKNEKKEVKAENGKNEDSVTVKKSAEKGKNKEDKDNNENTDEELEEKSKEVKPKPDAKPAEPGKRGRPPTKKPAPKPEEVDDLGLDDDEESGDVRPETEDESDFDPNDDGSDSDYGSSKKKGAKKVAAKKGGAAKKSSPAKRKSVTGSVKKAPAPKRGKKAAESSEEDEIDSESGEDERVFFIEYFMILDHESTDFIDSRPSRRKLRPRGRPRPKKPPRNL